MKNKLWILALTVFANLFFIGSVWAVDQCALGYSGSSCFLMLNLPTSIAPNFPVYVYQTAGGVSSQIDYVASASEQIFLGPYQSGTTSGTYTLYYQNSAGAWYGCTMVLASGSIVSGSTTCPGTVVNLLPSVNYRGTSIYPNAASLAVGASSAWTTLSGRPSPTPITPNYGTQARTITLTNNTSSAIQLGESCTLGSNPNNTIINVSPSCQSTTNVTGKNGIAVGDSYTVSVLAGGLDSAAFYVSAYKNGSNEWVSTGGYGTGETPYATKMEFTYLPVVNNTVAANNIDLSAVDGFNFGGVMYPTAPTYCTSTVDGESSNALGVGYYSQYAPLATLSSSNFSILCSSSTQTTRVPSGTNWALSVTSSGNFQGCYSPCQYAHVNNGTGSITQDYIDGYCCTGLYNTATTCNSKGYANNSTYVSNLHSNSTNVYAFAYDDATGDFACPGMTNTTVSIVNAAQPASTLSAPVITTPITPVGATTATVSWAASTDSNPGSTISYVLTLTHNEQAVSPTITYGTNSASISGLTEGLSYKAIVTASDTNGSRVAQSIPSQPAYFTTSLFTAPTSIAVTPVSANSVSVGWTLSQDTYPNASVVYTTTVSLTSGGSAVVPAVIGDPPVTVSGLSANITYYVVVNGADSDNSQSETSSPPVSFITESLSTPSLTVTGRSRMQGQVSWPNVTATGFSPSVISYHVTVAGQGSPTATVTTNAGLNYATFSVPRNAGGATYTVSVTAQASGVGSVIQSSPGTAQVHIP